MSTLTNIIMPHVVVFLLMFRFGMCDVEPSGNFRDDMQRLWIWVIARWPRVVMHPLYWAGMGIVDAYFLVGVFL